MRLLHTTRLEVVEVPDNAIPPYAILSHTWGSDELSFQDLRAVKGCWRNPSDETVRQIVERKGFAKVKEAAALAERFGHSYIWIDTINIDKTSSAELSEAINSMYRWYQGSEECYAFLSDVKSIEDEDLLSDNSTFQLSRWFTRGWTLQELIAPAKIHFFAHDWSYLGSKGQDSLFQRTLSKITGIDLPVLDGSISLQDLSVATRMKWVATRNTTRVEDIAYCLMGIFDVNMPLLYGEGQRAFIRLQEEILKVTDDQSLFAWTSFPSERNASDRICGLLATSPAQFGDVPLIHPLPPLISRESVPSSFTNQGLRVQLHLRPAHESGPDTFSEDYQAVLDCSVNVGAEYYCPTLYLRKLWSDQFARIRPDKCFLSLPPLEDSPSGGYHTVYVKQNPNYIIPEFTVPKIGVGFVDGEPAFDLHSVCPPTRWNSDTRTLKSAFSQVNRVMGVFRFGFQDRSNLQVDVVVGLRPGRRREGRQTTWASWCFQRRCSGQSLKRVFDLWDQTISSSDHQNDQNWRPSTYRSLYGEDHAILSNAEVFETVIYGRRYLSVRLNRKGEMDTTGELLPSQLHTFQGIPNTVVDIPNTAADFFVTVDKEISLLTAAGSVQDSMDLTVFPLAELTSHVRTKRQPSDDNNPSFEGLKVLIHSMPTLSLTSNNSPFNSLLLNACKNGDVSQAHSMVDRGASINCETENFHGFRPIHWAVFSGDALLVQLLVNAGVEAEVTTTEQWNIFHLAAAAGNLRGAKMLADSLNASSPDIVGSLLGGGTIGTLERPVHLAAANPETPAALLEFLLYWGYAPRPRNWLGETPLHRAAATNNTTAMESIRHMYWDKSYFNDADRYSRTPLWHAACSGSADAILLLVSYGASIDLPDDLGRTPLHIASREGRSGAVKALLEAGASSNAPTDFIDLTACHYAALFGHVECLRLLLRFKSPFEAGTSGGCYFRPIRLAAANGWLECVKELCDAGADPNSMSTHHILCDREGDGIRLVAQRTETVQELASVLGHVSIVQFLQERRNLVTPVHGIAHSEQPQNIRGISRIPTVDMRSLSGMPFSLASVEA